MHSHPDEARGYICASVSHFYTPYYCRLGGREQMRLGQLMVNPAYGQDGSAEHDTTTASPKESSAPTMLVAHGKRWTIRISIAAAVVVLGAAAVLSRSRSMSRR